MSAPKRPPNKNILVNKIKNTFSKDSEKKAQSDPTITSQPKQPTQKHRLVSFHQKLEQRQQERLKSLINFRLWQPDKEPPTMLDPIGIEINTKWRNFIDVAMDREEMMPKLVEFLLSLNPRYLVWNEEFEPGSLHRAENVKKLFLIPYINPTEAQIVMKLYFHSVDKVVDAIREGKPFHNQNGIEILYLMSILSRTADNRRAFDLALILTKLISLIKIVLIEYKTPFIMDLKEDETNDVEQLFAQLILGYSFQIMFNFITYYHFWHPLRFIYNSNDRLHEIDNEIISDSKAELLKQGLLNIMKGYLDYFNNMASRSGKLQGSQMEFKILMLNSLGSFLNNNVNAKKNLIMSGLLDILVSWIGWPDFIDIQSLDENTATSEPRYRQEFKCQLLCLRIFSESVNNYPQNAQMIASLGGWNRVQDFILWATEIFSINPLLIRDKFQSTVPSSAKRQSGPTSDSINPKPPHASSIVIGSGAANAVPESDEKPGNQSNPNRGGGAKAQWNMGTKPVRLLNKTYSPASVKSNSTTTIDKSKNEEAPFVGAGRTINKSFDISSKKTKLEEDERKHRAQQQRLLQRQRTGELEEIFNVLLILIESDNNTNNNNDNLPIISKFQGKEIEETPQIPTYISSIIIQLILQLFDSNINHSYIKNQHTTTTVAGGIAGGGGGGGGNNTGNGVVNNNGNNTQSSSNSASGQSIFYTGTGGVGLNSTHHNERVKYKLVNEYPELQLFVLEFIIHLLQISNIKTAILLSRFHFWHLLLYSDYFYYCGINYLPENTIHSNNLNQIKLNLLNQHSHHHFAQHTMSSSNISKNKYKNIFIICREIEKDEIRSGIFSKLKHYIFKLFEIAGSIHNYEPMNECKQLMYLLDKYNYDIEQCHIILQTLLNILKNNLVNAQQVLGRLTMLPIIAMMIQQHSTISGIYYNRNEINHLIPFNENLFNKCRINSLLIIDFCFIDNDELKSSAIKDSRTVNVLFSLLFEPTMRKYALEQIINLMSIQIDQSQSFTQSNYEEILFLYEQYFLLFKRVQNGSLPTHFELLLLLINGIHIIIKNNAKTLKLFREINAFKYLIEVVENEKRKNKLPSLFIEVVKAITSLMSNNDTNKAFMKDKIGYDKLKELLLKSLEADIQYPSPSSFAPSQPLPIRSSGNNDVHGSKPAQAGVVYGILHENIISLCFNLLVDGEFNLKSNYTIQNSDIIRFMFNFVLYLPVHYRNELFNLFIQLVDKCPLNQSFCSSQMLIYTLIEIVLKIKTISKVNPASNVVNHALISHQPHSQSNSIQNQQIQLNQPQQLQLNQTASIYDEALLEMIYSLVELLGTHSITVKELKRQFLLLKSEPGDFRPHGQIRLMKALQFMALSRSNGPETFFDLNGKNSALIIPPLEKWPHNHGYTFCIWARVESIYENQYKFHSSSAAAPQTINISLNTSNNSIHTSTVEATPPLVPNYPRLISFLDESGYGLEIFLSPSRYDETLFHLQVTIVSVSGKLQSHTFEKFTLKLQQWYFIIVTHTNQRKFRIGESEMKVYINSQLKEKVSMKYPQFPPILNKVRIGSNVEMSNSVRGELVKKAHYFFGQLGSILLFDDNVTTLQANLIFDKVTSAQLLKQGTSCFGNELESKIKLHYNCTARVGKLFLDLTPEKNRDKSMDAKIIGKLFACRTRDVKDIIHCIGGIKVILPIFAQLDQPELPKTPDTPIDYSVDRRLLLQSLALLGDMLHKSETNQHEMLRCKGFPVIGFLLQQSSPEHFSSETIVTLEDLAHKISSSNELANDLWKYVIFRWSIWIYTPAQLQWEAIKLLNNVTANDPEKFRQLLGVQHILDVCYFYYWYESSILQGSTASTAPAPSQNNAQSLHNSGNGLGQAVSPRGSSGSVSSARDSSSSNGSGGNRDSNKESIISNITNIFLSSFIGKDPVYHPVTKKLIGKRPSVSELFTIRKFLFSAVKLMIETGISESESKAILNSLLSIGDDQQQQVIELLDFIYQLILTPIPNFIDHLINLQGCEIFISIIKLFSSNEEITIKSLFIFSELVKYIKKDKIKTMNQYYLIVCKIINQLTPRIYISLFSILIGLQENNIELHLAIDDSMEIKNPSIFPILFQLLIKSEVSLRQKILQDIYLLLNNSDDNRDKFLQLVGWENWLFNVLIHTNSTDPSLHVSPPSVNFQPSPSPLQSSSPSVPTSNASHPPLHSHHHETKLAMDVCHEIVFNILKLLIIHSFNSEKYGKIIIHRVVNYLFFYESKGLLNKEEVARTLFMKILLQLNSSSVTIKQQQLQQKQGESGSTLQGGGNISPSSSTSGAPTNSHSAGNSHFNRRETSILPLVKSNQSNNNGSSSNLISHSNSSSSSTNLQTMQRQPSPTSSQHHPNNKIRSSSSLFNLINQSGGAGGFIHNITSSSPAINIKSTTLLQNVIYFVTTMEEFLFYTPRSHEISLVQQGKSHVHSSVSINSNNQLNPSGNSASPSLNSFYANSSNIELTGYSLKLPFTFVCLHYNSFHWADLELARALLDTLHSLKLLDSTHALLIDQVTKDSAKNSILRNGGIQRILLRISLQIIRQGDIRACVETVPRIREILGRDIANAKVDVNSRLPYVLSSLLYILKDSLANQSGNPTSQSMVAQVPTLQQQQSSPAVLSLGGGVGGVFDANSIADGAATNKYLAKAIVPLIKNLLRICTPVLPASPLDNQIEYFSGKCTIPEFTKSFHTPQWNIIMQWAQQTMTSSENEEKLFCQQIDKNRSKILAGILQQDSNREDRLEPSQELKLETQINEIHQKLLLPEIERKKLVVRKWKQFTISVRRKWRDLLRSLTNERAPWASNDQGKIYWKLDKIENFSRMRIRMKRNYNFDPHQGAARDYHGTEALEPALDENNQQLVQLAHSLPLQNENASDSSAGENSDGVRGNEENPQQDELEKQLKLFSGMKLAAIGEEKEEFDFEGMDKELGGIDNELLLSSNIEFGMNNTGTAIQEKLIYKTNCELITPLNTTQGKLEITNYQLYFLEEQTTQSESSNLLPKEIKIPIEQLKEVHLRRYLLRRSALEIFLVNRNNYFFNFPKNIRNKVYHKIISLNPPNLTYFETGSPDQILKKSDLTKKWQMRLISNFDYLVQLNTIAGRSYNDITQYPVFPWVLAEYEKPTIDLDDPYIYRDLSKPIGALNPERLKNFIARYENFMDDTIPKFHYGTHYSSSGSVLFYLIRTEPFTTQFLQLQGGKFDHADRMYDSIPKCWKNVLTGPADVKELIPEFYYFPDFLKNQNGIQLGRLQNGGHLNDVQLPGWASTPEEFIRIHRQALESDYVSLHLHEWIDLIFGYKQRGKEAEDAFNVFYYLTYEGAVDLDSIEDEAQRRATESQIDNFGQTPAQLLHRPHVKRLTLYESHQSIFTRIDYKIKPVVYQIPCSSDGLAYICMPFYYFNYFPPMEYEPVYSDLLVVITTTRIASIYKFNPSSPQNTCIGSENEPLNIPRRKIGKPFAAELDITSRCFACTKDGSLILSCGHWDFSISCTWMDQSKPIQSLHNHKDIVTCIALGKDEKTFVTGSKDTTILVWEIQYQKGVPYKVDENPVHILYGHNDDVNCVAIDVGLGICVSGSNDGTCIVHNLIDGIYLRSIYHPNQSAIHLVQASTMGHIVFFSRSDLTMYAYTINGDFVSSAETGEDIQDIFISRDAKYIVTGGSEKMLIIRYLHNMQITQKIPTNNKIVSITMSADELYILVALADGSILAVVVEEKAGYPVHAS